MKFLKYFKDFVVVPFKNSGSGYRSVISYDDLEISVNGSENILSIDPIVYCFHFNKFELNLSTKGKVLLGFYKDDELLSTSVLKFRFRVENLYVLEVLEVKLGIAKNLMFLRYYLLSYLKKSGNNEVSFLQQRIIASMYSVPRRVFICSFTSKENQNILFPIDLVVHPSNSEIIFYSIRKSNNVVKKIILKKQATLIYSKMEYENEILKLGKYHSNEFPEITELNFNVKRSKVLNHLIPEYLTDYLEIKNFHEEDLGNQMLFIGRAVYIEKTSKTYYEISHVHTLFKDNFTHY